VEETSKENAGDLLLWERQDVSDKMETGSMSAQPAMYHCKMPRYKTVQTAQTAQAAQTVQTAQTAYYRGAIRPVYRSESRYIDRYIRRNTEQRCERSL